MSLHDTNAQTGSRESVAQLFNELDKEMEQVEVSADRLIQAANRHLAVGKNESSHENE